MAETKHIPPSESKKCPCGSDYTVYNVFDFREDGTQYIYRQVKKCETIATKY